MPKENVVIDRNTDKEPDEPIIESLLQKGKPLNITEDTEQKKLVKEIEEEFEAIKKERMDIDGYDYDVFLGKMDNQKKGRMPKTTGRAYNLDCGLSAIKCGDVIRTIVDAILGVEPIVSISPRPGFAKGEGYTICQEQEQFIDYALDEKIPLKDPLRLAADSATYKKVGVIKWIHKVRKEPRIRTEKYTGKTEQIGVDQQTGKPILKNQGIIDFMAAYGPEVEKDPKKYEWILKKLVQDKVAKFDVQYDEIVYNDPFPKFVDNKNFYVRKATEGYLGLCETQLTVERVEFTYYGLKKLEKENGFVNVDKLIYDSVDDENAHKKRDGFANEMYPVLECVYMYRMGEEYQKIVCWISETKKCYLGGVYFPFTVIGSYYVPHHVKTTGTGFYQEGVAESLTDTHLSKNAILNHTLEAAQMATTITPLVKKGSDAAGQFLNNLWVNGMPIYAVKGEIDFLNNYIKPPDVGALLTLNQVLSQIGSEISGSSDLRSGKETPLDPSAPARKTAMLLQESGKNIKDYVDTFSQGFNIDVQLILRIYFEMNDDEQEYLERRYRSVTGAMPKKISKAAMMARTLIQSQAMAYDFNKMNAKRQDILNNQILSNESLIMNNPQANWTRVNILISSMDPKWSNNKEKLLPSLEEFNKQQAQIAVQAVQIFVQQMIQEAQTTQQAPKLDPRALMQLINQLQSMATMPMNVLGEKQKQQAKEAK